MREGRMRPRWREGAEEGGIAPQLDLRREVVVSDSQSLANRDRQLGVDGRAETLAKRLADIGKRAKPGKSYG